MNTYSVVDYFSNNLSPRSKVSLQQNLITFLNQGEKIIYYANKKTVLTKHEFAILSSGNYLMTEKLPLENSYQSTMLFFNETAISGFFIKHATLIKQIYQEHERITHPFLVFKKDEFIMNFISSLKLIQTKQSIFEQSLIALKFEELMLHLLEKYPASILSFQVKTPEGYSDLKVRKAVESNLTNNLKLEELAFLCNVSVSTFKRRFIKLYKVTPAQFFLTRRMEIAKSLLLQDENPSEVYHKVGYENHSSFSQAFKQLYGVSPKIFKRQNLIDSQHTLTDYQ